MLTLCAAELQEISGPFVYVIFFITYSEYLYCTLKVSTRSLEPEGHTFAYFILCNNVRTGNAEYQLSCIEIRQLCSVTIEQKTTSELDTLSYIIVRRTSM
jgi:hypothetical protein